MPCAALHIMYAEEATSVGSDPFQTLAGGKRQVGHVKGSPLVDFVKDSTFCNRLDKRRRAGDLDLLRKATFLHKFYGLVRGLNGDGGRSSANAP